IVLHRAGKDLRGRGRQLVDYHRQGAVVDHAGIGIIQHLHLSLGVAYQHTGALADEQAGQLGGLLQGAAAIVAQIQNDAVNVLFLQLAEQPANIAGGAAIIRITPAIGLEVDIEAGHLDHPDTVILALLVEFQHRGFGGLVLQFDRFTHQNHLAAGHVAGRVAGGNDFQAHGGALGAADQLDHFIKPPADHVDHFAVALGHADDAIGRSQLLALLRRTGRHQTDDLGVVVVALQHGADALEGQAHVDVEVLRVIRRHVLGMGVVDLGQGIDVVLEDVLAAGLIQALLLVGVALLEQLLDGLGFAARQFQPQYRILYLLTPEAVQRTVVSGPVGLLAVDQDHLVSAEVQLVYALAQQLAGKGDTLVGALDLAGMHGEADAQIAAQQQIVELVAVFGEVADIRFGKEAALGVEMAQVSVKDLAGQLVVQTYPVVVMATQQLHGVEAGDHLLTGRLQTLQIQNRDSANCRVRAGIGYAQTDKGNEAGFAQGGRWCHLRYRGRRAEGMLSLVC